MGARPTRLRDFLLVCNLLRGFPSEGGLAHPQLAVAHDLPEVLLCVEKGAGGPACDHLAVLPFGHAAGAQPGGRVRVRDQDGGRLKQGSTDEG